MPTWFKNHLRLLPDFNFQEEKKIKIRILMQFDIIFLTSLYKGKFEMLSPLFLFHAANIG